MFCSAVLAPIVVVVRTLIQVIREVVHTVCEWVSTVIRVVKEVAEKVCSWLPWPLSAVCKWVTKLVEVVETVWEWVCHEVIERLVEWVEILVEYVIYVLKWVCWVIDWVIRLPALILCWLGIEPDLFLGVCVKVIADDSGNLAVPVATVRGWLRDAAGIFGRCHVRLVVCDLSIVPKAEFLDGTVCEFSGMFSRFFSWFSTHSCGCCRLATVYVVRSIPGASGCAYPGTDWVTVAANGDGTVIVQEIGHLCDLWGHSSDPNNVMTDQPGGTHDQITHNQCCMIRTSRFTHIVPPCTFTQLRGVRLRAALDSWVGEPFERKGRGHHDKTPAPTAVR